MKSNIKIAIALIILVIFTVIATYFSFLFFTNKKPKIITNISIYLQNNTPEIKESTDTEDDPSYLFSIVNNSEVAVKYNVTIKDNSKDSDGIKREYLRYELLKNNKVLSEGLLSEINNDILLTEQIDANSKEEYTLKINVDESVDIDLENNFYNYDLKVEPILK